MNGKYAEYADDRLKSLRRTKDRARRWGGMCLLISAVLALLAAMALVDYWLVLPSNVRVGESILVGALAVMGLVRLAWRLRGTSTAKDIALELERRRPDLGCVLSTAVEYLPGGRTANEEYEPQMVAALQEFAARKLVVIETPWWRRQLLVAAGIAGGAVLIVTLAILLVPGGNTAAWRALAPWSHAHYTTIEVKPGNNEVIEGADQEIEAVTAGKLLQTARLEWKTTASADWQYAAMQRAGSSRFLGVLPCVTGDVSYRVTSRDTRSPEFKLTSFIPPGYKSVRVRITPPAYTKEEAHEEGSADLTVLRASRLDYEFLTAGVLTNARLRFANGPSVPLTYHAEGRWTNSVVASKEAYYWLDLLDHKGRKGGNDKAFKLTLVQDEKPIVDVIEPGLDVRSEPTNKISLTVSANDDYCVRALRLIYRKMNGPWYTNNITLPKGEAKEVETPAALDLTPLQLKPYEVAAYYVEALDNNTLDGPGVGKSPVYFVEYTTKEETLGQCHGGSKINLIEFEKQIIAATAGLPDTGEENKYRDVAGIQRQTKSYGLIYQDNSVLALAPEQAREEFRAALDAMDQASAKLDGGAGPTALASEESALRHLYETCRLLPELEAGMCRNQGNCVKVVLESIEKIKEQQKQERRNTLPQIIREVQRLIQLQQRLSENLSRPQPEQSRTNSSLNGMAAGNYPASSKGLVSRANQLAKAGEGKSREAADATEGQSGNRTNSAAANSPGRGEKRPDSNGGDSEELEAQGSDGTNPEKISDQQRELAAGAGMLSRKLAELSGKNPRVSFRYSGMVQRTSELWTEAGKSLRAGDARAADAQGNAGISILRDALNSLEVIYSETTPVSDTAAEEYPKDFEAQITEYLRRLSYAQ